MVNQLAIGTLVAAGVFAMIGTAGFCLAVDRARTSSTVAVAVGLATLGLTGWATFWAYLLSPTAGRLVAVTALVVATATVVAAVRTNADVRRALVAVLPAAAMLAGVAALTLALIALRDIPREPFDFARIRFSRWYLPVDNEIPQLLVDRLAVGGDPRTFMDGWQSSDRPPLQSGLMLLVHDLSAALGLDRSISGLTAGIAGQLTWIPGVAVLVRSIGSSRRGVLASMLFTAMTGTVLVNTLFTWPKLLSAAFVLAAMAVVFQSVRPGARAVPGALALTGVLVALGMLAHGAAMFAAPIVGAVVLHRWRALTPRAVGLSAAAAGISYLPWMLYQRFYDPPGSRLLYWHLAEIGYPDPGKGGVLRQVTDTYVAAGWHTTIANKWANLVKPFSIAPWDGIGVGSFDNGARRIAEFYTFSGAIGLGWIGATAALATVVVARVRSSERDAFAGHVTLLVAAGLGSLVLWALVMFGPGTTFVHHGSHVFILVALAAPLAWLVDRRPAAGALVVAAGVVLCLSTYVRQTEVNTVPEYSGPWSRRALVLALLGAACVALAFRLSARRDRSAQPLAGAMPSRPLAAKVLEAPALSIGVPGQRRHSSGVGAGERPAPAGSRPNRRAHAPDDEPSRAPEPVG